MPNIKDMHVALKLSLCGEHFHFTFDDLFFLIVFTLCDLMTDKLMMFLIKDATKINQQNYAQL